MTLLRPTIWLLIDITQQLVDLDVVLYDYWPVTIITVYATVASTSPLFDHTVPVLCFCCWFRKEGGSEISSVLPVNCFCHCKTLVLAADMLRTVVSQLYLLIFTSKWHDIKRFLVWPSSAKSSWQTALNWYEVDQPSVRKLSRGLLLQNLLFDAENWLIRVTI